MTEGTEELIGYDWAHAVGLTGKNLPFNLRYSVSPLHPVDAFPLVLSLQWAQPMALITTPAATAVIGCALRVHTAVGPGLFESLYEECLAHELRKDGLTFRRQVTLPFTYDGIRIKRSFTADLIVEESVLVELKSIEKIHPIHDAQMLTYMRVAGLKKGLLINFNAVRLKHGIKSYVLGTSEPQHGGTE